jgi:DNA transformation protein
MSQTGWVDHCLELLSPLGRPRAKRMFGGHGLYVDDVFIALLARDQLYLKVDEQTRPLFEAEGCTPFAFEHKGKPMQMSYFTAPPEAMDSPGLMLPWARLAQQAALRARAQQAPKRPCAATKKTPLRR